MNKSTENMRSVPYRTNPREPYVALTSDVRSKAKYETMSQEEAIKRELGHTAAVAGSVLRDSSGEVWVWDAPQEFWISTKDGSRLTKQEIGRLL
jgi:hypothetical protein